MLEHGVWTDANPKQPGADGRFRRRASGFRKHVGTDPDHPVESGRYVLVVAHPCPWSHRALLTRSLLGLERAVPIAWVRSVMGAEGWELDGRPLGDHDVRPLHVYYSRSDAVFTGSASVPVLWDLVRATIVNNESSEIAPMLAGPLSHLGDTHRDLNPPDLAHEVERVSAIVHTQVNEGVYRAGYAATKDAHDEAVSDVFHGLEELDRILGARRFLAGDRITLADVYAFPTLVRFDPVYSVLMRCDRKRITDYPAVFGYLRDLYRRPEFARTVDFGEYRRGYYSNLKRLNPSGVVPTGPLLDLSAPPNR